MTQHTQEHVPRGVVVGMDSSDDAAHAAAWAAREAVVRAVPLTLVHALHLPPGGDSFPLELLDYAERRRAMGSYLLKLTAETLHAAFPELVVDTELSDQAPVAALDAPGMRGELLVTGTRGHGGFVGMLVGSVTRRLAAHADCPLVVVRGRAPEEVSDEVVVGVGAEPEGSLAAVRYAFAAAQRYGARVHAVRAWLPFVAQSGPMGSYFADYTQICEEEEEAVEQLLAPLSTAYPGVKVEISVGRDNPVPVLIDAARRARLLVVGAHRHRGPLPLGAGYVAEGLLAHSPTPVAIVPSPPSTPAPQADDALAGG